MNLKTTNAVRLQCKWKKTHFTNSQCLSKENKEVASDKTHFSTPFPADNYVHYMSCGSERAGVAVMFQTRILEVISSNLGWEIGSPD
jgi:hypothetical protein